MDGVLIIDKPEGITSHDVVSRIRRIMKTRRVGHAGTLDPFATGVLVVCVDRATRLVQFLVGLDKEYIATVRLGFATDTQDLSGKQITPLRTSNKVSLEELYDLMKDFTGRQLQTPPMFSAKKIAGKRLHEAARAGVEIEREPVEIIVHSIDLIEVDGRMLVYNEDGTTDFIFRVGCSTGTYIRTLAHDIGARLGTGAHLRALRRVRVGQFGIENALTLDELESRVSQGARENVLVSASDALSHFPAIALDSSDVRRASNGVEIKLERGPVDLTAEGGFVRLMDEKESLVGVGQIDYRRETVRPRVVLKSPC